jgi:deoxyribose-phosphate aldolase
MTRPVARHELARLIELTSRSADLTRAELQQACAGARANGLASICVNGSRVVQAVHWLEDSDVKVTCAVGFPLGACDPDVKRYATEVAIDSDAHFIEVAANLGRLKDGDDAAVLRELRDVVEAADERPVGVYLNTELLTADEIRRATKLAVDAAAKGIALAGGVNPSSTLEALKLVRESAPEDFGIKVDLDPSSLDEIVLLLKAGATRFGLIDGAKLLESLP